MTHSSTEKNLNLDFSFKFFDAILSTLKTANFNLWENVQHNVYVVSK